MPRTPPRSLPKATPETVPAPEPTPGPMIDITPAPPRTLPAFTPVPRQRQRFDGWTPERQRAFIEALADTGSPKHAARKVGMTPEGAYLLRRHPKGEEFRKAWEAALALGVERLEDIALAVRFARQIGWGTARSTASKCRCIPMASSSAPAACTTTRCSCSS